MCIDTWTEQKSQSRQTETRMSHCGIYLFEGLCKKPQLGEQQDERMRKWLNWFLEVFGRSANTTVFFVLWGVFTAFLGWSGGINTPFKITCSTRTSLCYQVRFRAVKSALSDVPSPQCSSLVQTDKGLLCLLEKSSSKSQSSKIIQSKQR